MEVSIIKQGAAPTQERPASSAGRIQPNSPELATVAIKAAPEVPEFEKLDIDRAIKELQDFVDGLGRSLSFRRDESIDRAVITVRDTQSNQVVRQIPSEEIVAISRQIREELSELRAGLLFDSKT